MSQSFDRSRASREEIARQITPERALYFSKAAYDNAARLVDAAVVLHTHGHHGPARSLAISAREEFGKFFAALLHCAGVYDAAQFARLIRKHGAKQLLGATLALCGGPLKAVSEHIAPAVQVKAKSPQQAFDLIASQLEAILPKIPIPDEATIAEMQSRLMRAHSGGDDVLRTEALYVDMISTNDGLAVRSPSDIVSAADAFEEIETARAYLRWANPVMEAMSIGDVDDGTLNLEEILAALRRLAALAQQSSQP